MHHDEEIDATQPNIWLVLWQVARSRCGMLQFTSYTVVQIDQDQHKLSTHLDLLLVAAFKRGNFALHSSHLYRWSHCVLGDIEWSNFIRTLRNFHRLLKTSPEQVLNQAHGSIAWGVALLTKDCTDVVSSFSKVALQCPIRH